MGMMKRIFLTLLLVTISASLAYAETKKSADTDAKVGAKAAEGKDKEKKPKGEKYPYGASVNMGYGFNHANFVDSNGDFGWQRLSLGANVSYTVLKKISLSTGLGVSKVLATAYDNSGGSSKNTKAPWEINDISLSASYGNFYKIPVVDIGLSASLGLGFPLSKVSSAGGLIMSTSPGISASWAAAGFSIGLSTGYTFYLNDSPTIPINCDAAPQNCVVSGGDTAIPNSLHNIRGGLSLGYKIIDPLKISARYSIANGYSAVEFADDEQTSEFAQTGTQAGTGRHSFSLSLSYKVLAKTSITLGYRNGGGLYVYEGPDRAVSGSAKFNQPFFDTKNDNFHGATSYSIGISQSL